MTRIIAVFMLIAVFAANLKAQERTSRYAAIMNSYHQGSLFDTNVGALQTTDPVFLRPGFNLGIERTWGEGKRGRARHFQDIHVGYSISPYSESYTYIGTRIGADFKLFKQLRISPSLIYRAGQTKNKDVRYVYEGGRWVNSGNLTPGYFRGTAGFDMQFSYRFLKTTKHPIDIRAGANLTITTRFLPTGDENNFPWVYRNYNLGVRYSL
jgi:hypothetical protein